MPRNNYGYHLDLDKKCIKAPENCIEYNQKGCTLLCVKGYYADRTDRFYKPWEKFCYICSKDECLLCFDNYYFDTNAKICQTCYRGNCKICETGYYLETSDQYCFPIEIPSIQADLSSVLITAFNINKNYP